MGKGRILGGGTGGLYTIEILEDRTRAESNRATAVARVASIDTRISELTTELADAQNAVDAAAAAQDQAIADYQAALDEPQIDTKAARKAVTDASEALVQVATKRDAIARNIGALKSERLSVQKRIDLIDALPPLRQISAWCTDYTEDLAGDVATAEVPGEIGQVIIQPGFSDGAAWSPTNDGAIQPALSGTAASVFYNLAMMPGWQKWRPTFRIATISNISNDLCDITLDAATSSQQGLDVNAQGSYSGVPIMYMDCNGDAFEDGDRVLVAFSGNTDAPMVVGFEKEPKECTSYSGNEGIKPFFGIANTDQYITFCQAGGGSQTGFNPGAGDRLGIYAFGDSGTFASVECYLLSESVNKSKSFTYPDHSLAISSSASTSGAALEFTSDVTASFDLTNDKGGLPDVAITIDSHREETATITCPSSGFGESEATRTSTSLISVGAFTFDPESVGVEVMGTKDFKIGTSSEDTDWRLHYNRDSRANLYVDVEFRGEYAPPGEPIQRRQFHAAFYRKKGGSWYRVQSRHPITGDHKQMPDYESLPIV